MYARPNFIWDYDLSDADVQAILRGDDEESKAWNVIFLLEQVPPAKVLLLKRAAHKQFAPNLYTGIGGKLEPGEMPLESAVTVRTPVYPLFGCNGWFGVVQALCSKKWKTSGGQ